MEWKEETQEKPSYGERVLILYVTDFYTLKHHWIGVGKYCCSGKWIHDNEQPRTDVVAWMPLPSLKGTKWENNTKSK